ncbi:MAG TPA: GSCFA domain-containing protein [Candidatus Coprenecus stercoravium]|uniref:GSCFA domain-containing protein n=1 Tax=Candidatus Coprenecus stercoravium TaxID=2840735 RepID=A0A9D2GRB4_9BACT|nr:GSCFA domain-containing protein [Candidatus Coprenecus stercoravium]
MKPDKIKISDSILSLGSCFSTEMSRRLSGCGYKVLDNPFGVLFNPVSIANAIKFLADRHLFTADDVVPRDTNPVRKSTAGHQSGFVSFYHHGSFVRPTPEEFLNDANTSLEKASEAFRNAQWIIVTFGTAWTYRHIERNITVANCHKHPAWEFRREMLEIDSIVRTWNGITGEYADKRFLFTVSPIRHKKDGMHGNQLSKATLLLAVDRIVSSRPNTCYFPSYEIVLDELRDYKWFAEDQVHPSQEAIDIVWDRFKHAMLE